MPTESDAKEHTTMRNALRILAASAMLAVASSRAFAEESATPAADSTPPAETAPAPAPSDARLNELEQRLEAMSRELELLKVPQTTDDAPSLKTPGHAPAAAKVYGAKHGVSIGGYGESLAQTFQERRQDGKPSAKANTWDAYRAILYLGYKFNDWLLMNSEIEFEHAHSKVRGEVEVEFAYLDFQLSRALCTKAAPCTYGVRAGMLLMPIGLINELHEPTLFPSARRPNVDSVIIPTTWSEMGAGLYGEWGPVALRGYVVNGLQAVKDSAVSGFAASGIRNGRQKGSSAQAEDVAGVLRADVTGPFGVIAGGSVYGGRAGQNVLDATTKREIKARTTLTEGHVTFQFRGLDLRGLYARGTIGGADRITFANTPTGKSTRAVGDVQWGWYVQASYDVFSLFECNQSLSPFIRYERFDPQARVAKGFTRDPALYVKETTIGLAYKPHPQVVVKGDVIMQKNRASTGVNQYNVAVGYLF